MTQLVLLPAGGKQGQIHFVHTIEQAVSLSRIEKLVEPHHANALKRIFGSRSIPTWGVTEGAHGQNLNRWKRMTVGDIAAFGQLGYVIAIATVVYKAHAPKLALELWGKGDDREVWEHVFFLDGLKRVRVPYGELNKLLGYEETARIQGFNVLDSMRSGAAIQYLQSL